MARRPPVKKITSIEPVTFQEGDGDPVTEYWTAVEEIVEWAGKQYLVVQLPLPLAS